MIDDPVAIDIGVVPGVLQRQLTYQFTRERVENFDAVAMVRDNCIFDVVIRRRHHVLMKLAVMVI